MVSLLRLGVSFIYVLGVSDSYIWGLVFLRLGVSASYVLGLIFLRLGLVIVTFRGWFSYV